MKKYMAHSYGETEEFETIEDAKQWIETSLKNDYGDEIDADEMGACWIAEVILKPTYKITDSADDPKYKCPKFGHACTYECDQFECDDLLNGDFETWQYGDHEYVGEIEWVEVPKL